MIPSIETAIIHFTHTSFTIKKMLKERLNVTREIARIFVESRIPLPRFQSIICGPITGCARVFFNIFGELFAKQNEAMIKNTRPGIIGRIKPATPKPENRNPKPIQTGLGSERREKKLLMTNAKPQRYHQKA